MSTTNVPFYVPNGVKFGDSTVQTSAYSNANVATYLPTYTGNIDGLLGDVTTTANVTGANIVATGNIWLGGTPFVRTLTVGTRTLPVTVPMASNNTFKILLAHGGNAIVYTT